MVVGSRLHAESRSRFTLLHRLGNKLFRRLLNAIFDLRLTDILSGYRAFNRSFVKGIPLFGGGFEIEAELTIKGVSRGYRLVEVPVDLTVRREGSSSKIRLVSDGIVILQTIADFLGDEVGRAGHRADEDDDLSAQRMPSRSFCPRMPSRSSRIGKTI